MPTPSSEPPISLSEELAIMTAPFVKAFGGVISYNDPVFPTWPVVYSETPTGQMAWHLHPDNLRHVDFLPVVDNYPWDHHTTREKYARMARLVQLIPARVLTWSNPRLDTS